MSISVFVERHETGFFVTNVQRAGTVYSMRDNVCILYRVCLFICLFVVLVLTSSLLINGHFPDCLKVMLLDLCFSLQGR